MPNHFHLMVLVNYEELPVSEDIAGVSGGATQSRTPTARTKKISFNHSIGVMLASYTRAINKQRSTSGSLFREKTKAECVTCFNGPTPNFINANDVNIQFAEDQYPQVLFNYIHQNPVRAKLVDDEIDWEFSSAIDFYGKRNGNLINKKIAKEYVDF